MHYLNVVFFIIFNSDNSLRKKVVKEYGLEVIEIVN